MIDFISSEPGIPEKLMKHLNSSPVTELILKMVNLDEDAGMKATIVERIII